MMPQQTKWPFLAGLEDCSECKMYPFIYACQFDKFKFFILNKLILVVLLNFEWLILRLKMPCFSHQGVLCDGHGGGGIMVFCPQLRVIQWGGGGREKCTK